MNILICTIKSWNIQASEELKKTYYGKHNVKVISQPQDLTFQKVKEYNPDYVFFPHWSQIIPKDIYENFICIVFHMTDLPFGRGGSPLQNLIERGIYLTKISAIRVVKELDAGDIYLKRNLDISCGSASEIYKTASSIVFSDMIPYILDNNPTPVPQQGSPVIFKRRSPKDGQVYPDFSLRKFYDYIRMLDAEGYQNAYILFGKYKLSFKNCKMKEDSLSAFVEIMEVKDNDNE